MVPAMPACRPPTGNGFTCWARYTTTRSATRWLRRSTVARCARSSSRTATPTIPRSPVGWHKIDSLVFHAAWDPEVEPNPDDRLVPLILFEPGVPARVVHDFASSNGFVSDWSTDGTHLLLWRQTADLGGELSMIDLEGGGEIGTPHLAEALQYRRREGD